MTNTDVLIIGSGPAGMAAAVTARKHGLTVLVIDEQPAVGGQIWRGVEGARDHDRILGSSYTAGRDAAAQFRSSGAAYEPATQLWQIEAGFRAYVTQKGMARVIEAKSLILATGAQERPTPFPGWTLPGVLTVGAAQILLKSAGQIPEGPVWVAGCGPLPLLYMTQLLRAGGQIAGFLDTTPPGQWRSAVRYLPRALWALGDLVKGLLWSVSLRRRIKIVRHVSDIEARGKDRLGTITYRTARGAVTVSASTLLIHEGVVPNIHIPLSLGCTMAWNDSQDCFVPVLDKWCETSYAGVFVAGDGAGIGGAKVAQLRGELAALGIVAKSGRADSQSIDKQASAVRKRLARELAIRPFLDAMYKPRTSIFQPADHTLICRCEEVTAKQVCDLATVGQPGPNQLKSYTRAGMGPCQGRQCGYTVTRLLAGVQNRVPAEVGYYHVRPPLKPVTLGELASLELELLPSVWEDK